MKSKSKSEFVIKFVSFMAKVASEGSYAIGELIDSLGSISYKGVRYRRHPYYRGIQNLKKRGLLTLKDSKVRMTPKGRMWVGVSYLHYIRSIYPKWDRKWRVVIFDIPQEMHNARNLFRSKLKTLGFATLQKSIYVFPYPCEDELGDICKRHKLNDYVDIILADSLGSRQEDIKEHFNL